MNKTLIIHPDDRSTDFLKPIYSNVENPTLITGGCTKTQIKELIESHDQVIMLGHGSPGGLFSMGQFDDDTFGRGYIIDYSIVPVLQAKDNNIFIWCNADMFVHYNSLKGFYSGMFISETIEASYCGLPGTSQNIVDESNNLFAQIVGEVINEDIKAIYDHTKLNYQLIAETNPVALYNHNRLYLAE
jgi:hypothetical protein